MFFYLQSNVFNIYDLQSNVFMIECHQYGRFSAGDQVRFYRGACTRRSLSNTELSRLGAPQAAHHLVQRQRYIHAAVQPRHQNQQVCHCFA